MAKNKASNRSEDVQDPELAKEPLKQEQPGDYAKSTSQIDDAVKGPAAGGVRSGVTETDDQGNFTGRGATSNRANDPLVNRDATAPQIQVEKPETNVERSVPQTTASGEGEPDNGNWDMRVVPPYDKEAAKAVNENYQKVLDESRKDAPAATMGSQDGQSGSQTRQEQANSK